MGRKNRQGSNSDAPEIIYDDGPVSELVYWRDPKRSGAVFGALSAILIALTCLSLISVVAWSSLIVLASTFGFRLFKAIMQMIQKTDEGHPFKEYLDMDVTFHGDKAQELSNAIINYANTAILKLRGLFLVDDFVDSAKFGVFLYALTYIGGWFNGLTLIILGFIALFSLPKVYEANKTVIDQYIDLVCGKLSEINAKVHDALPFLKKNVAEPTKKEQ